jgi:LytR cell envelope-related transcriptional attenuator
MIAPLHRRALIAACVAGVSTAGAWFIAERMAAHTAIALARIGPRAPEGTRIRVQILNGTTRRGLAQQATRILRDLGYDVVEVGNGTARDTTVVIDRVGNLLWARMVADVLGDAGVESQLDSSRYLDVTVILGASWRAPPYPFRP